ncbi:MAG: hypothetical protein DMF59_16830 [Acidobacteria bacterium]|nr:MAG: hypothetical protein DMF59_16830 [Acidobacteriota bacterium]
MRILLATMTFLGLAYVFITPPMRVPDEHLHFFRSAAIANGHLIPHGHGKADSAQIPQGLKTLVWVISTRQSFQTAIRIPLEPVKQPVVDFPAWYTPVPYLPQAFAAVAGRIFNIRPLIIFYAGRMANLAVAIVLIALAMRMAPASWSADALTLAVAILFIALIVEGGGTAALIVFAFVLGLCKPAYFLLALLVFATPARRMRAKIFVVASMAVATIIAFAYARAASFQQRTGMPIDPAAQMQCVVHDPMHFARAMLSDIAVHWRYYADGTVGRLGLNELALPTAIVVIEVVTVIAAAITSKRVLNTAARIVAIGIFIATAVGVVLSQYMIWSIVCGDTIEGVQGRYFLPIVPLALLAISWNRWRFDPRVLAAVAVVCNAFAFAAIVRRYWM